MELVCTYVECSYGEFEKPYRLGFVCNKEVVISVLISAKPNIDPEKLCFSYHKQPFLWLRQKPFIQIIKIRFSSDILLLFASSSGAQQFHLRVL